MMNCLAEKLCCALLCLCTAACLPAADAYFTTFARGKWDPAMWVPVKSPRFSYLGEIFARVTIPQVTGHNAVVERGV